MFETLYSRPGVLRRHREAPLAAEREAYLKESAARGFAHETLLRRARYVRRKSGLGKKGTVTFPSLVEIGRLSLFGKEK